MKFLKYNNNPNQDYSPLKILYFGLSITFILVFILDRIIKNAFKDSDGNLGDGVSFILYMLFVVAPVAVIGVGLTSAIALFEKYKNTRKPNPNKPAKSSNSKKLAYALIGVVLASPIIVVLMYVLYFALS